MYLLDLRDTVVGEWDDFKNVFVQDKTRFSDYMQLLNKHRVDAHARDISDDDMESVRAALQWLEGRKAEFE